MCAVLLRLSLPLAGSPGCHQGSGRCRAFAPMVSDNVDAISRTVKGFVTDANFELSGYRAAERCWFGDEA